MQQKWSARRRARLVAAMWLPARESPPSGKARVRGRARAGGLARPVGQLHLPSVAKIARAASASSSAARRAASTSACAARRSSCCRAASVSSCEMMIYNRGGHRLEKGLQHVGIWAIACCGSCQEAPPGGPMVSQVQTKVTQLVASIKAGSGSSSRRADPDTRAWLKSRGCH